MAPIWCFPHTGARLDEARASKIFQHKESANGKQEILVVRISGTGWRARARAEDVSDMKGNLPLVFILARRRKRIGYLNLNS